MTHDLPANGETTFKEESAKPLIGRKDIHDMTHSIPPMEILNRRQREINLLSDVKQNMV